MKFILFFISLQFLVLITSFSQTRQQIDSALFCTNHFNEISSTKGKTDSAVLLLKNLAVLAPKTYPEIFAETIDNSFIQNFVPFTTDEIKQFVDPYSDSAFRLMILSFKERRDNSSLVLYKAIKDTNLLIQKYLTPLKYWVDAQNVNAANKSVKAITESFFNKYIRANGLDFATKLYYLKYALLLYQIENGQQSNKKYSEKILSEIYNDLGSLYKYYLVKNDRNSKIELAKCKWLYAYSSFIEANNYLSAGNKLVAEPYLRQAALLSPSLNDQTDKGRSYFYDEVTLTHDESHFEFYKNYINYLLKNNASEVAIQDVYTDYVVNYPEHKNELQKYYNAHNDTVAVSFKTYWGKVNRQESELAPDFSVKKIDGKTFQLSANKGKWILLDFWGTWCGPCRAEHSDLNNFYISVKQKNRNIDVITIACRDTLPVVEQYMKENNYSFPVAMQQEKLDINKIYPVMGYPSKFLINPDGRYIVIPFGLDWVSYINSYINDL